MSFETVKMLALIFGTGWATGLNLYLTAAALGIAGRAEWIVLPGNLQILENPLVIFIVLLLYLVEFVVDKVPYLDSAWDSVHTLIRPVGGAALAYLAMSGVPEMQTAAAAAAGLTSLSSHLGKAGTRIVINTSPEPFSNSAASVAEDGMVLGLLWLIFNHPWIALAMVIALIALTIWLIPKIFGFIKRGFLTLAGRNKKPDEKLTGIEKE